MTDHASAFKKVQPQRMRFQVLEQLRRAILDGRLPAGQRLNETEVAREMGISRGPVREALLALESEGLLVIGRRRGAYVLGLDSRSFRELVDVRILLEGHAMREAVRRFGPSQASELAELISQMHAAGAAGDVEAVIDYDLEFHHAICRLSGNRLLLGLWEQIRGRLRLAIRLSVREDWDVSAMIETHPPVLCAMREGDAERAIFLLHERMREAAEAIILATVSGGHGRADLEGEASLL